MSAPARMRRFYHDGDRRMIDVFADRKARYTLDRYGFPVFDAWPILWRRDVPALSDEDWYASPGDGWRELPTEHPPPVSQPTTETHTRDASPLPRCRWCRAPFALDLDWSDRDYCSEQCRATHRRESR